MTKHPSLTCMIEGGHSTMAPSEKMITNSESITLVGGFNPLEKYYCSQIGSSPPGRGENFKRKWNHHLDNIPNLGLRGSFRFSPGWRIAATKRARGETPEFWLPRRSRASPSPYPKQNGANGDWSNCTATWASKNGWHLSAHLAVGTSHWLPCRARPFLALIVGAAAQSLVLSHYHSSLNLQKQWMNNLGYSDTARRDERTTKHTFKSNRFRKQPGGHCKCIRA